MLYTLLLLILAEGVGANLFAKGPVHSPRRYRLNYRLRGQAKRRPVRSHSWGMFQLEQGT
ncbi:hypothetical protein CU665_06540 [Pseudomonas syringae pv. actinidifoliorum]|nr:hypothetical protein [Pseudomonas syringae pv. actinidifoliorum]